MCSCHSILECCIMFSGVKLSMGSFVLFIIIIIIYLDNFQVLVFILGMQTTEPSFIYAFYI